MKKEGGKEEENMIGVCHKRLCIIFNINIYKTQFFLNFEQR